MVRSLIQIEKQVFVWVLLTVKKYIYMQVMGAKLLGLVGDHLDTVVW